MDQNGKRSIIVLFFIIIVVVLCILFGFLYIKSKSISPYIISQKMLMVPLSESKIQHEILPQGVKDTVIYKINKSSTEVWKFYNDLMTDDGWSRLPMSSNFLSPKNEHDVVFMEALKNKFDLIVSIVPQAGQTEVRIILTSPSN